MTDDVAAALAAHPAKDYCKTCKHDFDSHSLVATRENNPLFGGVILCPVKGCDCYSTWSLQGKKDEVRVPDRFELEEIREYIQA